MKYMINIFIFLAIPRCTVTMDFDVLFSHHIIDINEKNIMSSLAPLVKERIRSATLYEYDYHTVHPC